MLSVQVHRIYKLNICLKLKTTETNLDFFLDFFTFWHKICFIAATLVLYPGVT